MTVPTKLWLSPRPSFINHCHSLRINNMPWWISYTKLKCFNNSFTMPTTTATTTIITLPRASRREPATFQLSSQRPPPAFTIAAKVIVNVSYCGPASQLFWIFFQSCPTFFNLILCILKKGRASRRCPVEHPAVGCLAGKLKIWESFSHKP